MVKFSNRMESGEGVGGEGKWNKGSRRKMETAEEAWQDHPV
jgi:hypothetical protein